MELSKIGPQFDDYSTGTKKWMIFYTSHKKFVDLSLEPEHPCMALNIDGFDNEAQV